MIEKLFFEEKLHEMKTMNGTVIKREMVEMMYDRLKHEDQKIFNRAIQDTIENPPIKFTFAVLKARINNHKPQTGSSVSHWNGTECEWCENGLIFYKVKQPDGHLNSYVARCERCKSYGAPSIPFYDGIYERVGK